MLSSPLRLAPIDGDVGESKELWARLQNRPCQIGAPNIHIGAPYVHIGAPNVHIGAPNVHIGAPNVHLGRRRRRTYFLRALNGHASPASDSGESQILQW
eukprot:1195757-Prorocentrum_minimum.AAC.2